MSTISISDFVSAALIVWSLSLGGSVLLLVFAKRYHRRKTRQRRLIVLLREQLQCPHNSWTTEDD